jgi:hypothetical protein
MVRDILTVRPKKETNEVWHIDMLKGDVRIRKALKDKVPLPPGGAVEFWYRDKGGKWKSRFTA